MSQPKIILVAGPTAAGKSALALELARKNRGIIINADAMQIYAGLPVLSAQPGAADLLEIPHRLYGVLDAAVKSSVGSWLTLAAETIRKTTHAGYVPILVGGTGLYFTALLGGLAPIPEIPNEVRKKVQALYDDLGDDEFRIELAKLDPETAARLAKNDRQRSIRAYEVALHTGQPLGHWHKQGSGVRDQESGKKLRLSMDDEPLTVEPYLLMPPRQQLYAACDKRFARMMAEGAIDEAKQFLSRNLDAELPAMKTLGLREIGAYLKNEITLDEAVAQGQQATRNYAKRQMTWFRNQWPYQN